MLSSNLQQTYFDRSTGDYCPVVQNPGSWWCLSSSDWLCLSGQWERQRCWHGDKQEIQKTQEKENVCISFSVHVHTCITYRFISSTSLASSSACDRTWMGRLRPREDRLGVWGWVSLGGGEVERAPRLCAVSPPATKVMPACSHFTRQNWWVTILGKEFTLKLPLYW